jgi:hypothetical protein
VLNNDVVVGCIALGLALSIHPSDAAAIFFNYDAVAFGAKLLVWKPPRYSLAKEAEVLQVLREGIDASRQRQQRRLK